MASRTTSFAAPGSRRVGRAAVIGACLGCAQVLGVPSDPELVASPAPPSGLPAIRQQDDQPLPAPEIRAATSGADSPAAADGPQARSDGTLPSGGVLEVDETPASGDARDPGAPSTADGRRDAGAGLGSPGCGGLFERVPVDVVFVVDNSGSMPEEAEAFEQSLPAFVALLENDEVDYRIILLSRHRRDVRSASLEASTSVCIAAPISGLEQCPSERPALGPRFFQYSIKIDDGDSFQRVLQAFATPDPFDATAIGWSEWLRPGARTIFIEITDSDSALAAGEFVGALQAAAPESFGSDPASPAFVFHSITGVSQKSDPPDIYLADEPIERAACEGIGSNPDNAGVAYQQLSRLTGGLRLSVCPAAALGLRLVTLASDAILRSIRVCDRG